MKIRGAQQQKIDKQNKIGQEIIVFKEFLPLFKINMELVHSIIPTSLIKSLGGN